MYFLFFSHIKGGKEKKTQEKIRTGHIGKKKTKQKQDQISAKKIPNLAALW